ncbi:unnamed protein product [Rangifer tarandus platyrhynchus]|uniref:Uncharacterized protein n=1 Tax=Rangifer tarandus platyrhynchus TaxID=3082113 RepID=A0ABN8ZA37_RANTA|nr:unnamed protein product [Rangifer tarandus platyrhynchus]CAI9688262.1 unnamed protein product [Rangifer tarandus platyrhynchus]
MEGLRKGWGTGLVRLAVRPCPPPYSSPMGAGHLREGRGIPTPSPPRPLRPLPASFSGVPRLTPPLDGRDPAGPAAQPQPPPPPPRTVEALSGLQQRKAGGSRPRARPRPLGLPGSSVRGWHHRARSHRCAPRHPHPAVRVSEATQVNAQAAAGRGIR